jgi:histidine triad (HIT) family protein
MACIFCAIVSGDAPCVKLHEDDLTITFLDLFPVARGHTLIVTKEHYDDIFSVSPEALSGVAANSIRLSSAIDKALAPDGLSVVQLNRAAAGQTVFHYHMHLIPRMQGDKLDIHSRIQGDADELQAVGKLITDELERS